LADLSRRPGEPLFVLIEALKNIERKLKYDRSLSFYQIPGAMIQDAIMLKNELSDTIKKLKNLNSGGLGVPYRDAGTDPNDLHASVRLFQRVLDRLFPASGFFTDYLSMIKRFKILSQSFRIAISELTTEQRKLWWSKNSLASEKIYISLGGVMDQSASETSAFMGTNTVDFTILRETYQYLNHRSGISLNDSQVSLHHTMFWPEIHQSLNSSQNPYKAINLGVLGSHHWGVAFPIAFPGRSGDVNPFPRNLLIKSIIQFISEL